MIESMSPMYEAKSRFKEVNPTKQLLQLLNRIERIETIINNAVAVKKTEVATVVMPTPEVTIATELKAEAPKRRGRPCKNADN